MRISVLITSYNQKAYLVEAIDSVLAQTHRPHQVIIIDDDSTDGSQDVIAGYASRYNEWITPIYHTQNQGVAVSRNDGLNSVTGDYVTYVDGDDRFLPCKLEIEASKMYQYPNVKLVYSNYNVIDSSGNYLDTWARGRLPEGNIFFQVLGRQFPKNRLFRSELVHYRTWQEIGFYDPKLRVYEDYEMRIRLTRLAVAAFTGQTLSEHRRLDTGLSKLDGRIYLDAFLYIRQKHAAILQELPSPQQNDIKVKLDRWTAFLYRRLGRQALRYRESLWQGYNLALHYYGKSLKLHRAIDTKFWLEFMIGPKYYSYAKRITEKWFRFNSDTLTDNNNNK